MRLYLSSYRLGESAGALLALLGRSGRAAIISNALDDMPTAARESYRRNVYDPIDEFAALGIGASQLDLRDYFAAPAHLAAALADIDLVWVMGGNSFILRRAMLQSGFDRVLHQRLMADDIVYGGFSAGAVVATPSLRGIELMDPPDIVPDGYDPDVPWDGLGLIDYAIVPHFASPHPEAQAAAKLARHYARAKTPFRALRDGEVIVQISQLTDTREYA